MKKSVSILFVLAALSGLPARASGPTTMNYEYYRRCSDTTKPAAQRIEECGRAITFEKSFGGRVESALYVDRGYAFFQNGQNDLALGDYETALALKPNDGTAYYLRGAVYNATQHYDEALDDYDRAKKLTPHDAQPFDSACWLRAALDRGLDLALADCDEAVRLDPKNADALDSRAFVQFKARNYPAVIADATAALAIDPKIASSLYLRGLAKQKTGDANGGTADIVIAEAIDSKIAGDYAAYDVKP